jgi:hypothetical protein
MAQTHLPQNWIQKLYVLLSLTGWTTGQFYHEIERFFQAWATAEGGTAKWNPLNTTNHGADSFGEFQGTDFNRITVANYTSPFHGIVMTAATLLESPTFYNGIVVPMRKMQAGSVTAENFVKQNKVAIEQWGTSAQLILDCLATIK